MSHQVSIWICLKCDFEFEGRQECPNCGALESVYSHDEEATDYIEHFDDLMDDEDEFG